MNKLIVILLLLSLSCRPQNDNSRLKAVAKIRYNGLYEVQLNPIYSTGPIVKWDWQIDSYSPTQDSDFKPIVVKKSILYPVVAEVYKPGEYIFTLRVYDSHGNESVSSVNANVTGDIAP